MDIVDVQTHASVPTGHLPLQPDFLTDAPSGHVFGWTRDAAIGWLPYDSTKTSISSSVSKMASVQKMAPPIALGYHTGHFEFGLLAQTILGCPACVSLIDVGSFLE